MNILKNKKFYASIIIDSTFLTVLFLFLVFIIKKIMGYIFLLQEFGGNLKNFESIIQENMSLLNNDLLLNNIELINYYRRKDS